jgi:hypothetical protein
LKRLPDRGLCGGPSDGGDDLAAYENLMAGMMPGWEAHNCRVTQQAMMRFGMVPGNDSRTVFRTLLGPLLCCCAFAEEAAASDRSGANRGRSDDAPKDCKWQPSSRSVALRAGARRIPLTSNTGV